MSLVLENQMALSFSYDADEDTLFAWVGDKPSEAVTYETADGHLVRLDPDTKEFVGVTIFDFEAKWSKGGIKIEWETEVERTIPWIPRIARKKREKVAEHRVLYHVGDTITVVRQ